MRRVRAGEVDVSNGHGLQRVGAPVDGARDGAGQCRRSPLIGGDSGEQRHLVVEVSIERRARDQPRATLRSVSACTPSS